MLVGYPKLTNHATASSRRALAAHAAAEVASPSVVAEMTRRAAGSSRRAPDDVQIVTLDGARELRPRGRARGGSARALRSRAASDAGRWLANAAATPGASSNGLDGGARTTACTSWRRSPRRRPCATATPRRSAAGAARRSSPEANSRAARGPRAPTRTGSCSARSLRRGRPRGGGCSRPTPRGLLAAARRRRRHRRVVHRPQRGPARRR